MPYKSCLATRATPAKIIRIWQGNIYDTWKAVALFLSNIARRPAIHSFQVT